jgi:RNA polymerase sigma-70 factor (ECF subfamily)
MIEDCGKPFSAENARLPGTDRDLVERAQQGDEEAIHELVERHASGLYRLAYGLTGNTADAEDVVQETFLGALRHLSSFRRLSSVKTWLTRILFNQVGRHRRSRLRRRTVSLYDVADGSESVLGVRRDAGSTAHMDARMDVLAALDALSEEHRQVVVLREMQGLSYAVIAEVLDIPVGTVESRLFRARQELRRRLADYAT